MKNPWQKRSIGIDGRKGLPYGNPFWGSKFMKCFMGCHILGGGTNICKITSQNKVNFLLVEADNGARLFVLPTSFDKKSIKQKCVQTVDNF